MRIISERIYLILFSSALVIASLLVFYQPNTVISIDWKIGIVTSLLSTVLTVIFLSIFLAVREEREWRAVKVNVYSRIGMELTLLFSEIVRFVEGDFGEACFQQGLLCTSDSKIRKELIFSKLSDLNKKPNLALNEPYLSGFLSDRRMVDTLLQVKKNLFDLQISYGRHLSSKDTEAMMRIQDGIESIIRTAEMHLFLTKLTPEITKMMQTFLQQQNVCEEKVYRDVITFAVKSLITELNKLWKNGLHFG